jgi:hypothetical protein
MVSSSGRYRSPAAFALATSTREAPSQAGAAIHNGTPIQGSTPEASRRALSTQTSVPELAVIEARHRRSRVPIAIVSPLAL